MPTVSRVDKPGRTDEAHRPLIIRNWMITEMAMNRQLGHIYLTDIIKSTPIAPLFSGYVCIKTQRITKILRIKLTLIPRLIK